MEHQKLITLRLIVTLGEKPPSRSQMAKQIRDQTKGSQRQPCYICGQHESITELHHVPSVETIVRLINKQFDHHEIRESTWLLILVWLCPNHHRYWHALKKSGKRSDEEFFDFRKRASLTREEYRTYTRLDDEVFQAEMRGWSNG